MNVPENIDVLFTKNQIHGRVNDMAVDVARDYREKPLTLVGTLNGAYMLLGDLSRAIYAAGKPDAWVDTLGAESYGFTRKSNEKPKINKPLKLDVANRHVLLVEDIADSRYTLEMLLAEIGKKGPLSIEILALLSKTSEKKVEVPIKYVGFEIPNRFVFGYGIDAKEEWRTLPFIAAYKEE